LYDTMVIMKLCIYEHKNENERNVPTLAFETGMVRF